MSWKGILKDDRGLGDTVSRITKRMGIKECGGCKRRKATLNKLIKYDYQTTRWKIFLWTFHKHGYDEFDEQEDDFTGTFEEAQNWATDKWDRYDLMAEVHPLYGGTGFELQDENGKTWMTHRTG